MRTIETVRTSFVERLASALKRPAMYGGETALWYFIKDLLLIDDAEKSFESKTAALSSRGYWTAAGPAGTLGWKLHGSRDRFDLEAVSIYAEMAYDFGYFNLERILTAAEWKTMRKGLRKRIGNGDWCLTEILKEFGQPSFSVGAHGHQVLGYSNGIVGEAWIYFDFEEKPGASWSLESAPNPPLRDVRLPAKDFSHSLVLTPFGRSWATQTTKD